MRKILPVAILTILMATGALAQTGGASGTSGGAAAKSGSDATAPVAGAKDGMVKPMTKPKKKKKM